MFLYSYYKIFFWKNWKQVDHWPKGIMSKCKTYSRIWPMIMKFAKLLTSVFSCSIRNIEIHPFYGRYIYNYYWVKMHYTLFQFSTLLHCWNCFKSKKRKPFSSLQIYFSNNLSANSSNMNTFFYQIVYYLDKLPCRQSPEISL